MWHIKKNKGFTLIEIMIVISIISVLSLVLVPQVSQYYTKSKESGIRTDFHTFQQSSEMYFRETVGANSQIDTFNNYIDKGHKVVPNGTLLQTTSHDPWKNPYEVDFGIQKITFSSYGKEEDRLLKPYSITIYSYGGVIDSCTKGFLTNNLELTKIKNLSDRFTCGEDIILDADDSNGGVLTPPATFVAVQTTDKSANLSWSSVQGATKYILKRDGVVIYTGSNTTYSDITLSADTSYLYTISAGNDTELSDSKTLSVTTKAKADENGGETENPPDGTGEGEPPGENEEKPPANTVATPSNFNATLIEYNKVEVAWDTVSGATGYILKRDGEIIYEGNNTTYLTIKLKPETTYKFELIAKKDSIQSSPSELSVKTKQRPFEDGTCANPYLIHDLQELQSMNDHLTGCYMLANDIDASETSEMNAGAGFEPIGGTLPFKGTFDGNSYTIHNLTINRSAKSNIGLFGYTIGATIKNVGLEHVSIKGNTYAAGLVGYNVNSTITNSSVTGSISGVSYIGGIAGISSGSTITDSFATGTLNATDRYAGGLVGRSIANSKITFSYADVDVTSTADYHAGGLVGSNETSIIENSYATGDVTGKGLVGGLTGLNLTSAFIIKSYATGNVTGAAEVGGFVGRNTDKSGIENSYATGNVKGTSYVGGFAGQNNLSAIIYNSYSFGKPSGTVSAIGGFTGNVATSGMIINSYYDKNTSEFSNTGKGEPLTTNQMKVSSSFYDWDFTGIWKMDATKNNGYPYFDINDPMPLIAPIPAKPSEGSGTCADPYVIRTMQDLQSVSNNLTACYVLGNDIDASVANGWNTGRGLQPLGISTLKPFKGTFDGKGYVIRDLTMRRWFEEGASLFGFTNGATIKNVKLENVSIQGGIYTAGIVGYNVNSTISDSSVIGTLSGLNTYIGGITGFSSGSTITKSSAVGTINATERYAGGLVGRAMANSKITFSSADVNVTSTADYYAAGLVGSNEASLIENSYATGDVSGKGLAGGLVGASLGTASIKKSYAIGNVTGTVEVGGFIGRNSENSSIENAYATGKVTGTSYVGGFSGYVNYSAIIYNSYSIGKVTGTSLTGGFAGATALSGMIINSYYDQETTGMTQTDRGTPMKTIDMKNSTKYADWDFTGIWKMDATKNNGYPYFDINDPMPLVAPIPAKPSEGSGTCADPYVIRTMQDLQSVSNNLTACYVLGNDIDASVANGWNTGRGLTPLGVNTSKAFKGTFDGKGYVIRDLTMRRWFEEGASLFGYTSGATIKNVKLENVSIQGGMYTAGIVGYIVNSTVSNSSVTGSLSGLNTYIGGIAGFSSGSTITKSSAVGTINAAERYAGGLVGRTMANSKITFSSADVNVTSTADYYAAGLVGSNETSFIENSYATGDVSGKGLAGGLVGANFGTASIKKSYATGNVTGTSEVGGFIGRNTESATIENSYAIGKTTGTSYVGGFAGYINYSAIVYNSYSIGKVTGTSSTSGFAGGIALSGMIINSYYDKETSGHSHSDRGEPLTTNQMKMMSSYNDWNFTDLWKIDSTKNNGYPFFDINEPMPFTEPIPAKPSEGSGTCADPYVIRTMQDLQSVSNNLTACYVLGNDIDASVSNGWNTGRGLQPIGVSTSKAFKGTFDGKGYVIRDLTMRRWFEEGASLFGFTSGATIKNVKLENVSIKGGMYTAGIAGYNVNSTVSNSSVTGSLSGLNTYIGGIAGFNSGSTITKSSAIGTINATERYAGGLVGRNVTNSKITFSSADVNVTSTADYYAAGLVGSNEASLIENTYATGDVTGKNLVGGLVGVNYVSASIKKSYATGDVTGVTEVGGFVGRNSETGTIENAYATGNVSATSYAGAFAGQNLLSAIIYNSYSIGKVTGTSYLGGFIGYTATSGMHIYSYFDKETSGYSQTDRGIPMATADMKTSSMYVDWNFTDIWMINPNENNGYPYFDINEPLPLINPIPAKPSEGDGTCANPYVIRTMQDLQSVNNNPTACYVLGNDIDASVANGWNAGKGIVPIGIFNTKPFKGTFDGNGYVIRDLTIRRWFEDGIGFFGYTSGATIKNVALENVNIEGNTYTGGLVGYSVNSTITDSHVTGMVAGRGNYVGGIVGYNTGSTIIRSYTTGILKANSDYTGGLAGRITANSKISFSYSKMDIVSTGNNYTGGLVGLNETSIIENSYATGDVTGKNTVGGLVGVNYTSASIKKSYSTGSVIGASEVGGIAARNTLSGIIENSYATGDVTGTTYVGGFVGLNNSSATILYAYSNGKVTGTTPTTRGGLIGSNGVSTTPLYSYYDQETSTLSDADKGKPMTSADMKIESNYANWDFVDVWEMDANKNNGYPTLK